MNHLPTPADKAGNRRDFGVFLVSVPFWLGIGLLAKAAPWIGALAFLAAILYLMTKQPIWQGGALAGLFVSPLIGAWLL